MNAKSPAAGRPKSAAGRLKTLRAELAKRGLDGFIVPRGDEHQGEYVAARSERLAWLTGFTGSAGMAVVLARRAALFVDGRYTLQAAAQADAGLYDLRHITSEPATDWIEGALPKGGRLGYDPWLLTPAQVPRFREACQRAGGDLVPVDGNPVDAVWTDQPPPPAAPVRPHPLKYAGLASADKRRAVADQLKAEGQDAQILSAPDSIAWLLNIRGSDVPRTPVVLSFAVIHKDAGVDWFIDPAKVPDTLSRHLGKDVRVRAPDTLGELLDRLARKRARLRIDPMADPMWIAARLADGGARVDRAQDLCVLPKACKNATEIKGMRAAHLRDGAAMARFLAWFHAEAPEGRISELEASDKLYALRRENDLLRDLSFDTISGSGPNGAIVHYKATPASNRRIRKGDLYLIDSGAQYLDGTTDITRTVAVARPSKEARDRFTRVLKGHIALARARFPRGTTGSQLDPLARQFLWAAGLDFDHGTGHGVGSYLSVHEGPQRISKMPSTVALEPGMVISNEPGYYKTGAFGIRIENLVLVREAEAPRGAERDLLEFETLTLAPIDRALIDTALLDAGERAWLDAYHARVRKALLPLVDTATRAWLKAATAPLGT
ncbi:MAG: X-Pro aminopeptidase [Rhodospirillales bacterium CG15_BIG_FIL_POST_REV_8_21_14_020_66_15]|nr:MAG: X-Pro aminopeptidase [Rhodospirillales bacterium CG15_BIG_FIL_POST_REV_8_21_14_020_66_15]